MIRNMVNRIDLKAFLPKQILFLVKLLLAGLLTMTIFRGMLFFQEYQQLQYLPQGEKFWLVFRAFMTGLRFDLVVSGYILALPFLLLSLDAFGKWNSRLIYYSSAIFAAIGYVSTFFVSAADLPYMHHFHARANVAAFISVSSGSSDFLKGMVFQEWRYYWAIAPFLLISFLLLRKMMDYSERYLYKPSAVLTRSQIIVFPFIAGLLFLSVWGSLSTKGPIDNADAYTSDYSFTNQLGLNPMFTFGQSCLRALEPNFNLIHFVEDETAVTFVKKTFNIPDSANYSSPLARAVTFPEQVPKLNANVVVVMMESMSAHKMGRYGNTNNLTPFIDSLAKESLTFDSIFCTGIHTFAGIYSILYSQPVIKKKHPFKQITPQTGLSNTLRSLGYHTLYFTTHDEAFDEVGPFLRANGFDRIVSKPDYPEEMVLSSLGVPDDYLYHHATKVLDSLYHSQTEEERKPFFAALMTGSDHGPYIIPDYFKPKQKKATLAIVEYVDWSVRKFLEEASQKEWFDNTIFVFVADHGAALDKRYDLPITYLHTPLIFYAPKIFGEPKALNSLGSQLDIFPTIMGMLHQPYVNNTFGVDLLRERREFAISYADVKFAVLNSNYMYLSRENGLNSLYQYNTGSVKDYSQEQKDLKLKMKNYGEHTFQAAQYLILSGKSGMQ